MYKKVELKDGFVGMEQNVAKVWKEKDIVKKNFAMNEGKRYFTFYDGPPTANGKPHVGHIETRVMKDIIPRYKVMKGYHVDRKAGWDTHGLPVELEIEKKLGISGKQQIEEYGVEKFVKECKESVFTYVHMWEEMTNKVGYWVDMEHPYVTARSVMSAIDSKYENGEDFALIDELCRISGVKIPAAVEEIRSAAVLHNTVVDRDEMKQTVLEFLGL